MTKPDTSKDFDIRCAIDNLGGLVECRCDSAYTGRGLHDPQCLCEYKLEVAIFASAVSDRDTLLEALDGLLIALSTGKGISEATDNAKEAMCLAAQGKE